jgi:hypothetical protein
MICRVAFTVLLALVVFAMPAAAQRLTPEDVQRACARRDMAELCYASRRGSAERNQFAEARPQEGCRMTGLTREDMGRPVRLCPGAPGYWTNAGLQQACRRDPAGPCRYFIDGAVSRGIVEMRLRSRQAFCFRTAGNVLDHAVQLLPGLFLRWISVNPGRAQEPAALGIENALADAYPCSPEEAVIRMHYDAFCDGAFTEIRNCSRVQPVQPSR